MGWLQVAAIIVLQCMCMSTLGQLVIAGVGDIEAGRFFVELYAKSSIPDLSIYTLVTENNFELPSMTLSAGQYVVASNKIASEIKTFFNASLITVLTSTDVDCGGGDDPVFLKVRGDIVDCFGVSGIPSFYHHGWANRVPGVEAPKTIYDAADWVVMQDVLKDCWITEITPGNDNCAVSYAVQEFQ
ncbi:hypothetical protein CAPTEDRAFT_188516, partial [Capitella teleta]